MTIEQPICMGCFLNNAFMNEWSHLANIPPIINITPPDAGLTWQEKDVLKYLGDAWNHFNSLQNTSTDDHNEFRDAIHRTQQIIALRVARRVDKDVWSQPQ